MAKGIKIWATDVKNIYIGSTACKEVFVWTTKVRPTWWKPWANTIAYYKLEEDLNDYSWNNRNLSVWGGTFSYSTLTSGKKYCVVNTSTYTNTLTIPFNKNAYTFSVWFNINAKSSSRAILTEVVAWSDYRPRVQTIWWDVSALTSLDSTWVSWVSWQWYYATVTYENWTAKCYINGSLVWTKTFSGSATSWTFYINPSNAYYRAGWGITELIIENKTRSAQDVADYFDQTKANYWIS